MLMIATPRDLVGISFLAGNPTPDLSLLKLIGPFVSTGIFREPPFFSFAPGEVSGRPGFFLFPRRYVFLPGSKRLPGPA